MAEEVKNESQMPECHDYQNCYNWNQIKNIAFCKASKLAGILPGNYVLYYITTYFKTLHFHEWAKFIYGFMNPESQKITYIKYHNYKKKHQVYIIEKTMFSY